MYVGTAKGEEPDTGACTTWAHHPTPWLAVAGSSCEAGQGRAGQVPEALTPERVGSQ